MCAVGVHTFGFQTCSVGISSVCDSFTCRPVRISETSTAAPPRIDIMRSLRHPHIVELHFSFQDESHVYLGSWFAKKVSIGFYWSFQSRTCLAAHALHCQNLKVQLGLQRLSNIYLPEQEPGMEFAEGGGMFDLLSKQLFYKLNKFHF